MIRRQRTNSAVPDKVDNGFFNLTKGIAENRITNDTSTVLSAVNLRLNNDNTASLRKPIILSKSLESAVKAAKTYLGDDITLTENGIKVFEGGEFISPYVNFYDFTGTYVETQTSLDSLTQEHPFDFTESKMFNTPTSTIISGVKMDVTQVRYTPHNSASEYRLVDANLYDDACKVQYRYMKLWKDDNGDWQCEIVTPQVPNLRETSSGLDVDPDTTMDNPYALRDTYNSVVPSVKGIVPYTYAKPTANGIRPVAASVRYAMEYNDIGSFLRVTILGTEYNFYITRTEVAGNVTLTLTLYDSAHNPVPMYVLGDVSYVYSSDELPIPFQYDGTNREYQINFATELEGGDIVVDGIVTTGDLLQTVDSLTESVKDERMYIANVLSKGLYVLKAFCNLPKTPDNYYCTWLKSSDGVNWHDVYTDGTVIYEPDPAYVARKVEDSETVPTTSHKYHQFPANMSVLDALSTRPDILTVDDIDSMYEFRIVTKYEKTREDQTDTDPWVDVTVGMRQFQAQTADKPEFVYYDLSRSVNGEKLFYKNKIYTYGDVNDDNNIYITDAGTLSAPFSNTIDLQSEGHSMCTTVLPWRNHLINATEDSIFLSYPVENGYTTKIINGGIGIPLNDNRCAVQTLNGVIFKSYDKIYMIYPNLYASDDTILNCTDLTDPVESILQDYEYYRDDWEKPFAIGTDSEYVLMMPRESDTVCLRYKYTDKVWMQEVYPVVMVDFNAKDMHDIRLYGKVNGMSEFYFDRELTEIVNLKAYDLKDVPYGDILTDVFSDSAEIQKLQNADYSSIVPIHFEIDTGQKTNTVSITKQFVETKLMFATLSDKDMFPIELTVHIDGDPRVHHLTLADNALVKTDIHSLGKLGVGLTMNTAERDLFNVFRQVYFRYSGKGKSIRHIISGNSLYNFKFYEAYYRYRIPNVKQ